MLVLALCAYMPLYVVSVVASYAIVGDRKNDATTRKIMGFIGRAAGEDLKQDDPFYWFVMPWIPLLNTYLIYRTVQDNIELSLQMADLPKRCTRKIFSLFRRLM